MRTLQQQQASRGWTLVCDRGKHCTGHSVLGKCFQMGCISEWNHYCECGQLEAVEYVANRCPFAFCRPRLCWGKLFPQAWIPKRVLESICFLFRFSTATTPLRLIRLIGVACWGFVECQNIWYRSVVCYNVSQVSVDPWNPFFSSFFQLSMGNLTPSNIWTCNKHWHRYFAGLIEKKKNDLKCMYDLCVFLIYNFYL